MKKFMFVLLIATVFFTTITRPTQSYAAEEVPESDGIKNGHIETFYDDYGNKTDLEYLINDEELRVNTYVNGILVDFAIREAVGEGEYSEEIIYTEVFKVDTNDFTLSNIEGNTKLSYEEVNNVEVYNVNQFLTEVPTFTTNNVTLPRPYSFIKSKYNSTLKLTGYLYGKSETSQIKKFMFDFKRDVALSVVAAAITTVFSTAIVAIAVLLGSLGVSYTLTRLTDSLNGYYDATRKRYSYYVTVRNKETYKHNQEQIDVYYYNSKNGKKNTRVKKSGSWMSEDAILNVGIFAGS